MWSPHVQTNFIITFIGDDRPGLVESLSQVIAEHHGNWLESRLSQLAGKFAGLISISVPEESTEALQIALKNLSEQGSISIRGVSAGASQPHITNSSRMVTLNVLGPDRPGIVREIAAALSSRQINVVDMESYVSPAPMSAEMLFHARVEAQIPEQGNLDELSDTLDTIANEMDVDLQLEEN
jgi:glycine cleavage system regulatory protein